MMVCATRKWKRSICHCDFLTIMDYKLNKPSPSYVALVSGYFITATEIKLEQHLYFHHLDFIAPHAFLCLW